MKYELHALETLVAVAMDPAKVNGQKSKKLYLQKCIHSMEAEVKRVSGAMMEAVFNCENVTRIKMYVQRHQDGVLKLLNVLDGYIVKGWPTGLKAVAGDYERALAMAAELWAGMDQDFRDFLDLGGCVPNYLRRIHGQHIKVTSAQVQKRLVASGIAAELAKFVVQPFSYFLDVKHAISLRDLEYLLEYERELKRRDNGNIDEGQMRNFLLRLNFNDPAFAFYYIQQLKTADETVTVKGQIEYYYAQLKTVNQLVKVTGNRYDESLPSIQDQLATWLGEEIYFLEKKQQLEISVPSTPTTAEAGEKLQTNLSVAQLSLGVKLLLDTGVIKSRNTSEVLRMVSRNFRTDKKENISEDSLRNKVYNIDPVTVRSMRDVIVGLLNEVRGL